jgi:hypothetical protein
MGSNCTINLLLMSDSDFVVFSAVRSLADIDLAVGSLLNITNSTSDSLIFVTSNAINVVFWAANLSQTERVSFSYELGFTPSEGNVFSNAFMFSGLAHNHLCPQRNHVGRSCCSLVLQSFSLACC